MKKVISAIIVLSMLLFVGTPARAFEWKSLPVQSMKQGSGTFWCWAATNLAILNRYDIYPGVTTQVGVWDDPPDWLGLGQCVVANTLHTDPDLLDDEDAPNCCLGWTEGKGVTDPDLFDFEYCAHGFNNIYHELLFEHYGLDATYYSNSISKAALKSQVFTNERPVVALWKCDDGGHNVTITGVVVDSGTVIDVEWMNSNTACQSAPGGSPGDYWVSTWDDFSDSGVGSTDHEWVGTTTIDENPPNRVKLRYSWNDVGDLGDRYHSNSYIEVGPEYNITVEMLDVEFVADNYIKFKPGTHIEISPWGKEFHAFLD